jgi:hypothetical protein
VSLSVKALAILGSSDLVIHQNRMGLPDLIVKDHHRGGTDQARSLERF